jgi:hypothetical protein
LYRIIGYYYIHSNQAATNLVALTLSLHQEFIMSHYPASLHSAFEKAVTAFDFACAVADRLYWLDDNYVQPFYSWAAPRLREVAISSLYWALVTLIDIIFWLMDTTRQFMARDAHEIALNAFAQSHESLPSMAHAPVFPSPVVQWVSVPEALDDLAMILALCSAVVPMSFSSFVTDDSVQRWLTAALPLVLAPWVTEALTAPVSP